MNGLNTRTRFVDEQGRLTPYGFDILNRMDLFLQSVESVDTGLRTDLDTLQTQVDLLQLEVDSL